MMSARHRRHRHSLSDDSEEANGNHEDPGPEPEPDELDWDSYSTTLEHRLATVGNSCWLVKDIHWVRNVEGGWRDFPSLLLIYPNVVIQFLSPVGIHLIPTVGIHLIPTSGQTTLNASHIPASKWCKFDN